MAETSNIAVMAEKISDELFKYFKWERLIPRDMNFACHKGKQHQTGQSPKVTHPVDVVFKYTDPYSGTDIILNTDLKSYKSGSITPSSVRDAIYSLAMTIDCADGSDEWKTRYSMDSDDYEIRGMLFVYNHDGEYDKSFKDAFKPKVKGDRLVGGIKISNVPLREGQQLHIMEPLLIQYMRTIISDMDKLHRKGEFPESEYSFYYPDLLLNKLRGDTKNHPATIELISGPYMLIKHNEIKKYCEVDDCVKVRCKQGFIIYYNQKGENPMEFVYLFDLLRNLQLLRGDDKIRIRVAHREPFKDINSIYNTAKSIYINSLGGDSFKENVLKSIEFDVIEQTKDIFCTNDIGWRL
ncbi:hypothetical protein [Aliivibrio fischeri]|uniref:hypothetical protein n=1 Tax=Aliivibrio fischeri TaxID=668 RepID=UPI00105BAEFC|nr:hypothetical protein [Aliivibrio fischeri]TDM51490.1 hypothetical protein VFFQA001_15360 [Aliivibrio fischeri]